MLVDAASRAVAGIYRHYKGKDYRVFGLVRHSESLEMMVVYECLYDNELGRLWARPEALFFGELTVDGQMVRRFTKIGD